MKPLSDTWFPRLHGVREIAPLIAAAAFVTAISVVLILLRRFGLLIAWIALHAAAVALVLLARRAYFKWLADDKPSYFFADLGKRNMDAIAVGSTKAWKYLDTRDTADRLYPCLTYRRSLTMDIETLKTFFSHVRPGGTAFLFIDWKEIQAIGETIYARDWKYANPLSFLRMGINSNDITKKEPLLCDTRFLFGYVLQSVPKRLGLFRRTTWNRTNAAGVAPDPARAEALVKRLEDVAAFCRARELRPVLMLLSGNAETNRMNEYLQSHLDCAAIVPDARSMNALIRQHLSA